MRNFQGAQLLTISTIAILHALATLQKVHGFTKPSSSLYVPRLIQGQAAQGQGQQGTRGLAFLPKYNHDRVSGVLRVPITLKESASENNDAPPKRTRRKRKDGKNAASIDNSNVVVDASREEPPSSTSNPPVQVQSVPSTPPPASMEIMDVRDLVSGKKSSQPSTTAKEEVITDEEDDDDDEYEYYYEDEDGKEVVVGTSTPSSSDNSLELLLADAKRMREESGSEDMEEPEETLKSKVKNVLSTIVTADFFVVCALLAWFLAGIFCSYIIKDDTVQIAFNGMYQKP